MSEQEGWEPTRTEFFLIAIMVGAGLIMFFDQRFRALFHVGFVAILAVLFWRNQDRGLITRWGDPHLFWLTIAIAFAAVVFWLVVFVSDMRFFA